ncbi:MAG: capsular polysaccharide biosynthesis protein [Rhodobacteraceae bacterium]|nr:capsular polysaccharide biosynthesis protein [Paracoccaceae bacterium]
MSETWRDPSDPEPVRRLRIFNGGFLTQPRVRRILALRGWQTGFGRVQDGDHIGVWGQSPTAHRGEAVAALKNTPIVRVEDAFLRSLFPGRVESAPPLGLLIDTSGVHFDPSQPSDLEKLLATDPLDDAAILSAARDAIAALQAEHLTKYTAFDPLAPAPEPGYVLVVDQTKGDASVTASGADRNRFLEMLFVAREDHPNARILIKTHPETQGGHRPGHFTDADIGGNVAFFSDPVSPYALLEGAIAVYCVSSQFGFEAILAGHKPHLFGQPFYAGWGLTQDAFPIDLRQRKLTRAQLFAGAMMLYPAWYDPYRDALTDLSGAMQALAAETRAWREDHHGWSAAGIRMWKRQHMQRFFGRHQPMKFDAPPKPDQPQRRHMVWASTADVTMPGVCRVEDGFLRSKGLGAELVPPMSLVVDDLGIYYDPTQASRLETLIRKRATLRQDERRRAEALVKRFVCMALSKYNVGGAAPTLPEGRKVLVVGQVEDDASIRLGTSDVTTNAGLLAAARAARPDDVILYKPHPDVEAGLRIGTVEDTSAADLVLENTDIAPLLSAVDEVWTMTSLTGFEALLRGVHVVTLGAPFYAGWGLTEDRGDVPPRRREDISLAGLVHATLIDYPRYLDPVTGAPCPVEVVVDRLATGAVARPGAGNRILSKLQGVFASQAHLWR